MSSTARLADRQRGLLAEVADVEAEEARLFARKMVLRARMEELWNPPVGSAQEQFGVLELAGTARIGQTRAGSQLLNGTRLVRDLPGTLAALRAGRMFRESAVLLLELTRNCTPDVVRELERRVLPTIVTANTTEVRRLVLALVPEVEADLDPELTRERLEAARARRSVWQTDRGEGMVDTTAQIDALSAKRWALDFEELVRAQKIADDKAGIVRSADQRRADVFAQLPSRFLALLQAVRKGRTEALLALSLADPDVADTLEALAATLPDALIPPDPEPPAEPPAEPMPVPAAPPADLLEQVPLPPEPPPDPGQEPDPDPDPGVVSHWTELSWLELTATVMGLPVRNPALLNVHVPMSTLLELDHRAGRIDQGAVVPACQVRLLLPTADLRRVVVDPDSGVPIGIDPTIHHAPRSAKPAATAPALDDSGRLEALLVPFTLTEQAQPQHDPSPPLRRLIELRDQQCTGIGCSQPARRCHLDHETPHPQGPTAAWNLSAKSARCHRAKHTGWTVTRHGPGPQHGQTTWTSPLGHRYTRLSPWTHPTPRPRVHEIRPPDDLIVEIDIQQHAA